MIDDIRQFFAKQFVCVGMDRSAAENIVDMGIRLSRITPLSAAEVLNSAHRRYCSYGIPFTVDQLCALDEDQQREADNDDMGNDPWDILGDGYDG